ncbi:MAG: lysylphosphatidylglycerol synthase transmembrane domain-containing protein [Pirellula sp.]
MKHATSKSALLIHIIKIALGVLVLSWIVYRFPEKDWQALVSQPKDWRFFFAALLSALFAHIVSFWRWKELVNALGLPLRLLQACRLGFLGTALNMVSVGSVGGDVFKAIAAARLAPGKRAEVVTSVLVDRAIGLLGLVIVASISLSLATQLSPTMRWIWIGACSLSAIGCLALVLVMLFGKWVPIQWLQSIPNIGKQLYRIANACMIFDGRPGLIVKMIVPSLLVHSFLTIACWLLSCSLYSSTPEAIPTLAQHFQAIPPAMAAATLPITPGGVGIQEILIGSLFQELPGISSQFSGLVVATAYRAILIAIAILGGILYLTGNERRLVEESTDGEPSQPKPTPQE